MKLSDLSIDSLWEIIKHVQYEDVIQLRQVNRKFVELCQRPNAQNMFQQFKKEYVVRNLLNIVKCSHWDLYDILSCKHQKVWDKFARRYIQKFYLQNPKADRINLYNVVLKSVTPMMGPLEHRFLNEVDYLFLLQNPSIFEHATCSFFSRIFNGSASVDDFSRKGFNLSTYGQHILNWAIEYTPLEFVNRLLQEPKIDPSAALVIACSAWFPQIDMINLLLSDKRVDPSANDNAAIRKASSNERLNIVERLLDESRVRDSLSKEERKIYEKQIAN